MISARIAVECSADGPLRPRSAPTGWRAPLNVSEHNRDESTAERERAALSESAVERERADKIESTVKAERARLPESAAEAERAIPPESTESGERAASLGEHR
jgi:hypothetical protein